MHELIHVPAFTARFNGFIAMAREAEKKQHENVGPMRMEFTNAKEGDAAEISIYGIIGDPFDGSDANTLGRFLRDNRKRAVNVRINSPGGLAFDGITIHNALLQHDGKVTTTIEGSAGSAASIIAVAGSPARIYENANFFIHRASLSAGGNADVFREALDWLDQLDEAIARTYKAKTGKSMEKVMEQMIGNGGDGTPFSARDAVANKYVDEIVPLKRADAKASNMLSAATIRQAKREDSRRAFLNQCK